MTLTQIAESPADAMLARLDRARAAFAQLDQNTERWAMLDGRLYIESSDGTTAYVTDGRSCDCPDSQIGQAARWLNGVCRHCALHWLIEQDARHFALAAEAEESRRYWSNERTEQTYIGPHADGWYTPTVKGTGETEMEYAL